MNVKYAIILFALISCTNSKKDAIKLSQEITCFSTFIFGSNSDTIRHFGVSSYLFKDDSLTVLRINKKNDWIVEKTFLSQNEIKTINKLLSAINFKCYLGNTIHKQIRENNEMYCGAHFGFIDSIGNVEVFLPVNKERTMDTLVRMLFYKKTNTTNDTDEIINYTNLIKQKYLKIFPHLSALKETVNFVPPIMHEDQNSKE